MKIKNYSFCSSISRIILAIFFISISVTFAEASDYQFTQITSNGYTESGLQQNDNGNIVWYSTEGTAGNLYQYDGVGTIKKLTNNNYYSGAVYRYDLNDLNQVAYAGATLPNGVKSGGYVSLNNKGDVAWQAGDGMNDTQVYRYSSSNNNVTQISNVNYNNYAFGASEPVINDSGQIAWYQGSSDGPRDVYRYDPVLGITKISSNNGGQRYELVSMNNLGQIMFRGPGGTNYGTWIYNNGGSAYEISKTWYGGQLNNSGQMLRQVGSDLFLFDIALNSWSQITNDGTSKMGYYINDLGQIIWSQYDGHDYELFLYDKGLKTQITSNDFDDYNPVINNIGQIAFLRFDGITREVYQATSVPEPASMLLFSLGLLGLAGVRRKLKK